MKIKSLIKESHAIAFIYGVFGIMYILIIAIIIILASHYCLGTIVAVKAASGTLIYLLALSLINIIMAILAWKIVSLSNRVQRTVMVFAIFLAIYAIINLITAISSWFPREMPDWYSPFYNIFPAALFTLGYGYGAYALIRILRLSNNPLDPNAG